MTRYLVIDHDTVVNIILGPEDGNLSMPGLELVLLTEAMGSVAIGWSRVDGVFVAPVIPEEPVDTFASVSAEIAALQARLQALAP